jgi:hypothetical protein
MIGANDPLVAEFLMLNRKYNTLVESSCITRVAKDAQTQVTPVTLMMQEFTFSTDIKECSAVAVGSTRANNLAVDKSDPLI